MRELTVGAEVKRCNVIYSSAFDERVCTEDAVISCSKSRGVGKDDVIGCNRSRGDDDVIGCCRSRGGGGVTT